MKKIFLVIAIGLFCMSAFSQKQQNRHEFTVWAGGPVSTLNFDAPGAEQVMRFGFQAGVGYNYFLNYNWSIGTGLEFSLLQGKLKYNRVDESYFAFDNDFAPQDPQGFMTLNYRTDYYEEPQQAMYLNIPLQLKFQHDAWKNHKYYFAVGPKIGIPMKATYKHYNNFSTSFTYDWSGTLLPNGNMQDRGIGTYGGVREADLDLRVNFIAAIEGGIKWKLNEKFDLYTGVYLDYGLNDIRTTDERKRDYELFQINSSNNAVRNYTSNSFLQSKRGGPELGNRVDFVDRVNTLSFGAKVALAFGSKPFNKKEKTAPAAAAAAAEKPYEGLTAAQMEDIMARNNQAMMEFQRKEFEALRDLITKEDPELTQAIINFDLDKKDILSRMHYELEKKVTLLKKYPNARLMLEGHTDDYASDEYNYQLGLDRANAAKAYLVARGIDPGRLSVSSKGKTQPAVPNTNDANRFQNRRVEFILIQ